MNGPDLRFLAERAAVIEDRTPERVSGVDDRIASMRRRRRTGVAVGVAGLVIALVAGVAVLDRGLERTAPSPAPSPGPTEEFDPIGSAPDQGTCWAVPPERVMDPDYWFDDSEQVPCTEPHTVETAGLVYLSEATPAEAEGARNNCWLKVARFLALEQSSWIPWGYGMFLPSREEVDEGGIWLRCDVFVPETWTGVPTDVRTVTGSLRGAAIDPSPELRACLDRNPTVDQEFVPCDQPHAYEQTGTLVILAHRQAYPSAAVREAQAQRQCELGLPAGVEDVAVTAFWDPPEDFEPGNEVAGACFFSHRDGTPLPP